MAMMEYDSEIIDLDEEGYGMFTRYLIKTNLTFSVKCTFFENGA